MGLALTNRVIEKAAQHPEKTEVDEAFIQAFLDGAETIGLNEDTPIDVSVL